MDSGPRSADRRDGAGGQSYVPVLRIEEVRVLGRALPVDPAWRNFCDLAGDPSVAAALQLAVTGTTDGSGTPLISNLTTDMFTVSAQCGDGPCSTSGCPAISPRPDYIMVSMPAGYVIQPRIPLVTLDPIPLRPFVIMPFGGTT